MFRIIRVTNGFEMIKQYYKIKRFPSSVLLLLYFNLKIKKLLKQKDIYSCKIFNFKNWHLGYAYFTAIQADKKVFIKIDTKLLLLQNDVKVFEIAKNSLLKESLVKIYDSIMLDNMQLLITEYLDGVELSEHLIIQNPHLEKDIEQILENLNRLNIIHRDIKLDNFFIVGNKLRIIDFTFAISSDKNIGLKDLDLSKKINCEIMEGLGMNLNPAPFVWNDVYTFRKILLSIDKKSNHLKDCIDNLDKIKTENYTVKPKSEFYFLLRNIKISLKEYFGIKHSFREFPQWK
jgi:serine/threonine protein kinase